MIGVLVTALTVVAFEAPAPSLLVLTTCETPEPVALATVWSDATDRDPGYRAAVETIQAWEARRSAVRREWAPQLSMEGFENWGQRLSPSEERALGVGFRGELRLLGSWTFLDGERRHRASEADLFRAEAEAAGRAFDVEFRAELARLYVEAASTEALFEARIEQRDGLRELADPVERRLAAGVDARWEGHLLDESLARAERLLAAAEQERAGGRAVLSALLGRCVRPTTIHPGSEGSTGAPDLTDNPELLRLHRLAEAGDATADVERNLDRFRIGLTGGAGPVRSRAFVDDSYRMEYLLGFTARWSPDLSGARGGRAAAEEALARSVRAQAESQRMALTRELHGLAAELERSEERAVRLEEEVVRAETALQASLARWREGVGHWTDVIDAHERLHEARQEKVVLDLQVALALIRYGEAEGRLDAVPGRLGQESLP